MTESDKIGSAILGFYAAIKICEREGLPWKQVAELVELQTRRQRPWYGKGPHKSKSLPKTNGSSCAIT